jgi:hypothetical protein
LLAEPVLTGAWGLITQILRGRSDMNIVTKILTATTLALGGAALAAPAANADQFGYNCTTDNVRRGFLGLEFQSRTICDTPTRPDGSWGRTRTFWIPAHQVPTRTTCSGGSYSSTCSTYPGYWADDSIVEHQKYDVFTSNVLPDEPGHLPV